MACQKARDPSQASTVVEGRRKRLGLAQDCQDTPRAARRSECRAQSKPEIDGLLARLALLWQLLEGAECLLEGRDGLAIR